MENMLQNTTQNDLPEEMHLKVEKIEKYKDLAKDRKHGEIISAIGIGTSAMCSMLFTPTLLKALDYGNDLVAILAILGATSLAGAIGYSFYELVSCAVDRSRFEQKIDNLEEEVEQYNLSLKK